MHEKRKHTRFRLRKTVPASINAGGESVQGDLDDISEGGFRLLVPLDQAPQCRHGLKASGEIELEGSCLPWTGEVCHVSIAQGSFGIGICLDASLKSNAAVCAALDFRPEQGEVTAIKLHNKADGFEIDLIGHFGQSVNRDCLHLIRSGKLRRIDLAQCGDIDSTGLALLQIAAEHGVAISGEQGRVEKLLELAGVKPGLAPAQKSE